MPDELINRAPALQKVADDAVTGVETAGKVFLAIIDQHCQPGRETSLAKTKVEEAVLWAVKGISG